MKPLRFSPSAGLPLTIIVATFCMVAGASAQTRTWTTTTPTGDSGNWSDTTKWSGTDVPDTAGENATFGAYANNRTVAMDGNFTIGALTIVPRTSGFNATTFALTGSNTLTINGGLTIGGGTSITIAPDLVIAADQTWTTQNETGVATLALNGIVSGPGKITRSANGANTSAGIITFSNANTFSGGFQQGAAFNTTRLGSSSVATGGLLVSGPLGTGTVTLNAGSLSSNGGTARTLGNNIVIGGTVNLGNSSQNGALTFSDAGLTTATTFTLSSATSGNVTVLRSGNTALTFDQVIAESGGTGQSVLFASTSGTPSVTLNRTKSATGHIIAGGVALSLNNGAANSGSLIGVNSSITATGANKFSTGALIADNTALIATDATNFSAISGGRAAVYNNGRVSFATDQSQASVAGLLTSDSQVRLGLGSGSGSATVTENYNQGAIGNGTAGLVSASTGTITYTGVLTSGSDSTFRVGGGLGTLSLTGTTLTGSGKNVVIEGGGTVNASANQDFTGTTAVRSSLTLSGSAGTLSATSGIAVQNTTLTLDNTTANANRLANAAGITLNRGTLAMNGSTTAIAESIGTLTVGSGYNTISMGTAAGASNTKSLTTATLARSAGAVALFRGDNFGLASGGGSALTRNLFIVSTAPTGADFVGGAGANGSTNISIIPWARTGSGTTATGGNFLTFDSSNNSLRPLIAAEFATNVDTAVNATDNVRQAINVSGTTTLLTADRTRNSLILQNAGATGAGTGSLGGFTLSVTSGAVDLSHTVAQNFTLNNGTLAFGSAEGVITNSGGSSSLTSVGAIITGSNGLTVMANNGGTLGLAGVNTFTGGITVGSNGNAAVAVDQDVRFGNAANSVTHAGGTLQFFATFTSTRGLSLLGNVGNNTLANNTTSSTLTWNGDISGAGLLRLTNNASTVGAGGFTLGGNNSYTGGTQIEGINVGGSTNNAFGTGTVTLIGANSNPAALTLTGAAPTLGGLRGTDGSVTISPSAATATLTVGSNNESTVFNGSLQQATGKTASFTKTGTGTLALAGNSSYTGTTTVSGGTLNLLGTTATSAIDVTAGKLLINTTTALATGITVRNTATLGGGGTALGPTTLESGGRLAPGNSTGVTSFANLSMQSGSDFEFELTANTAAGLGINYDGVNILSGGSLVLGAGVTSSLVFNSAGSSVNWVNSFWDTNQSWRVVDVADNNYTNPLFSSLTLTNDSLGQSLASIRSGASFDYAVSGGDIFLNYSVVPEPGTAALLACFGSFALLRRRRG